MKLIEEIVDLLSAQAGSLTEALLKTKVLLHGMGQIEIVSWVNRELNGYGESDQVPDYRIAHAQVLANLTSLTMKASGHPLPILHLSEERQKSLEEARFGQSIAVLESYAEKDERLQNPIPMEFNDFLGETLAPGVEIISAWTEIQPTSVVQILTEVRSRLLDFILNLGDKLPDEPSREQKKSVDAMSLFNHSVLGDNATIIIGDKNKVSPQNLLLKGNLDALGHELKKYAVPEEDIDKLMIAIKEDAMSQIEDPISDEDSGVSSWIQNMLHKAVDASWNIELSVAASIIRDAIKHYYGV